MNENNYIVLMAGGKGTRLWPISRESKPKQFHKFASDKSLLQETFDRISPLVPRENIYISLGNNTLRETGKQLRGILKENYLVEPVAKNTAPGIAYVTAKIFKKNPKAIIATISSDHTVNKIAEFQKTINSAFDFAEKNPEYLITVGIKPTSPHTGYGYIRVNKRLGTTRAFEVSKFVEKPDLKTAKKYLNSGKYLWNASYFTFVAGQMIKMFEKYNPEIYQGLSKLLLDIDTPREKNTTDSVFRKFPTAPIDTAIAEKVKNIAVIPADLGWSDIGSWSSLYDLLNDNKNDQIVTKGHHVGVGDKNCLFFAEDKLLATVGLEDIIIVDTPDATLVCHKNKSQEIKDLIEKLKKEGKTKYL